MILRSLSALGCGIFAVVATATADRIDENTHVKLGSAIGIFMVVFPAVWWVSSWMRGVRDEIKMLRRDMNGLPCQKEQPTPKPKCRP